MNVNLIIIIIGDTIKLFSLISPKKERKKKKPQNSCLEAKTKILVVQVEFCSKHQETQLTIKFRCQHQQPRVTKSKQNQNKTCIETLSKQFNVAVISTFEPALSSLTPKQYRKCPQSQQPAFIIIL